MAKTYWISFRIHEDAGYSAAYEALVSAVKGAVSGSAWWYETTSFFMLASDLGTDVIVQRLKKAIEAKMAA